MLISKIGDELNIILSGFDGDIIDEINVLRWAVLNDAVFCYAQERSGCYFVRWVKDPRFIHNKC